MSRTIPFPRTILKRNPDPESVALRLPETHKATDGLISFYTAVQAVRHEK